MINRFAVFFRFRPWKLGLLFLLTLVQGLTQGVGLVLIVPLLGLTGQFESAAGGNRWVEIFAKMIEKTGWHLELSHVLAFYGLLFVFISLLAYWQSMAQTAYQQEFSYETRTRLFRKLITSDWSFLNQKSKHLHLQVLTTEVPKMTLFYYYFLTLAINLIFILTHLLLALLVSPLFTLLIVGLGLFVFLILSRFLRKSVTLGSGNILAYRDMIRHIDDFWLTIKGAKVHRSEQFYFEKYQESSQKVLDFQYRQVKNRSVPQLIFSIAGLVFLIIMIWLAVHYLHLAVPTLLVLILLFARVFPKIKGLNNDLNMMLSNLESVRIIQDLEQQLKDQRFKSIQQQAQKPLKRGISIDHLTFGYTPDRMLFQDFSAFFPACSITGIFGASGRGKTTLVDLMVGLISPDAGHIFWDGTDVFEAYGISDTYRISYISQDSFFVNGTVRENLIWDAGRDISDTEILETAKAMQADSIIENLPAGLHTHLVNFSFQFSGGERQRFALVRALLRKPNVLILDESTGAIDTETENKILKELRLRTDSITIIFITHRENLGPYFDQEIRIPKPVN